MQRKEITATGIPAVKPWGSTAKVRRLWVIPVLLALWVLAACGQTSEQPVATPVPSLSAATSPPEKVREPNLVKRKLVLASSLIYTTVDPTNSATPLRLFARNSAGQVELVLTYPGLDLHFSLSPDGRKLAAASQKRLWLYDWYSGDEAQLVAEAITPIWSPDSSRLAFLTPLNAGTSASEGTLLNVIRVRKNDTFELTSAKPILVKNVGKLITWGATNELLALPTTDRPCSDALVMLSPTGQNFRQIGLGGKGIGSELSSPRGDALIYSDCQGSGLGTGAKNYLLRIPSGKIEPLATIAVERTLPEAAWSADGKRIAYGPDLQNQAITVLTLAQPPSPARQQQLVPTKDVTGEGGKAWSPDGKWLAYVLTAPGSPDQAALYLIGASGNEQPQLLATAPHIQVLGWKS